MNSPTLADQIAEYRMLKLIHTDRPRRAPSAPSSFDSARLAEALGLSISVVTRVVQRLDHFGVVELFPNLGGTTVVIPDEPAIADRLDHAFSGLRRRTCLAAVLATLYERADQRGLFDEPGLIREAEIPKLADNALDGQPWTFQEIRDALTGLAELKLVERDGDYDAQGWAVTRLGKRCAEESGGRIEEWHDDHHRGQPPQVSTTTYGNITNSGNLAISSAGAHQSITNSTTVGEMLLTFTTPVRQALESDPTITTEVREAITDALDLIEDEARDPAPRPARLRTAARTLQTFAGAAAAGVAGNILYTNLPQLLETLRSMTGS
ncbi:MAG: hypothetical protein ACK5MT_18240 [Actinomycetales bacterium]